MKELVLYKEPSTLFDYVCMVGLALWKLGVVLRQSRQHGPENCQYLKTSKLLLVVVKCFYAVQQFDQGVDLVLVVFFLKVK